MGEQLPSHIKYWLKEAKHDCFFVVEGENGSTERIGAVKILLMGHSEPFRVMLQDSELAEKGDIRIKDIEPGTFWNFLKCVYGGSTIVIPDLDFDECAKLLYVVEKYLANNIKTEVYHHIISLFSSDKLFLALSHPICYQYNDLKGKILNVLQFDTKNILMDDKFVELSDSAIAFILQISFLPVREIDMWDATLRWAKYKTDSNDGKVLRSYMFSLLKYFRFITMDYIEFWEKVVSTEILLKDEVYEICKAFGTGCSPAIEHLSKSTHNRYNLAEVSKKVTSTFIENPKYECAYIRCTVSEISNLKFYSENSKTYHWAEHLWNIVISKEKIEKNDYLSIYCNTRRQTKNCSCSFNVEITLMNQSGKSDITLKYTHIFSESEESWGWDQFSEWTELVNPEEGFVKDDKIIVTGQMTKKELPQDCIN